jgi:hypothetical protein
MNLFFDLILYVNIQNFVTINLAISTWILVHTKYTLLDYHSTEYIQKAQTWINTIHWLVLELGFKSIFKLN